MSLKGYREASLRSPPPPPADAATIAWDWGEALIDKCAYMVDEKYHGKNHTSACRRFRRSVYDKELEVEMQVSLCFAPPPGVSYFCCSATCPDDDDDGEQEDAPRLFVHEPWMTATECNLALFSLCHGHNSAFSGNPKHHDYFLYEAVSSPAGTPELTRLPQLLPDMLPVLGGNGYFPTGSIGILRYHSNIPTVAHKSLLTPPSPILSPAVADARPQSIPFTPPPPPTSVLSSSVSAHSQARPNDDACDAYRIVALAQDYLHPVHPGYYLGTYDSKACAWSRKPATFPQSLPPDVLVPDKAITIGGSGSGYPIDIMGWVDLSSGMVLCDVLAGPADDTLCAPLRYLPLPKRRQPRNCLPLAIDIAYYFRDIALVKDSGIIRFVDLQVHAEPSTRSQTPSGWTVVTWTLEGLNGGLDMDTTLVFRQEHELHSHDILNYNLPQSLFISNPILSSLRDGVLYLLTNASSEDDRTSRVIAVDLNQKTLLEVEDFDKQRPNPYMSTDISSYLMPAAVSKEKEKMKRRAPVSPGSSRKKLHVIANPEGGEIDVGDAMDCS